MNKSCEIIVTVRDGEANASAKMTLEMTGYNGEPIDYQAIANAAMCAIQQDLIATAKEDGIEVVKK